MSVSETGRTTTPSVISMIRPCRLSNRPPVLLVPSIRRLAPAPFGCVFSYLAEKWRVAASAVGERSLMFRSYGGPVLNAAIRKALSTGLALAAALLVLAGLPAIAAAAAPIEGDWVRPAVSSEVIRVSATSPGHFEGVIVRADPNRVCASRRPVGTVVWKS